MCAPGDHSGRSSPEGSVSGQRGYAVGDISLRSIIRSASSSWKVVASAAGALVSEDCGAPFTFDAAPGEVRTIGSPATACR